MLVLVFLVGALGYLNERELLYLMETARQILKYPSANVSTELASIPIQCSLLTCCISTLKRNERKGG